METILVMSLSGSGMFVLTMLWKKITKDRYEEKVYYFLLKLTTVFFLLPLGVLRDIYMLLFREIIIGIRLEKRPQSEVLGNMYFAYDGTIYLSDSLQKKFVCLGVWLTAGLSIMVYQLLRYCKCHRKLMQSGKMPVLESDEEYIKDWANKMGIRRKVLLRPYDLDKKCNFTVGVIRPLIVYDTTSTEEERQKILRHELVHIKHMDMCWAILMWAVICVHGLNPLVWILKSKFEYARERACDEETMEGCTLHEREKYARLIFKQMSESREAKCGLSLSAKGKQCKERVENIMKFNRKRIGVTSVLGIVLMVFMNTLTVFAYPEVSVYDMNNLEEMSDIKEVASAEWRFVPAECAEEFLYLSEYNTKILYEYQFVNESGEIYEMTEEDFNDEYVERLVCYHDYESGYSQMHVNMPGGGCILYTYESERCTLCGDVKTTALLNKIESTKCPHQ